MLVAAILFVHIGCKNGGWKTSVTDHIWTTILFICVFLVKISLKNNLFCLNVDVMRYCPGHHTASSITPPIGRVVFCALTLIRNRQVCELKYIFLFFSFFFFLIFIKISNAIFFKMFGKKMLHGNTGHFKIQKKDQKQSISYFLVIYLCSWRTVGTLFAFDLLYRMYRSCRRHYWSFK